MVKTSTSSSSAPIVGEAKTSLLQSLLMIGSNTRVTASRSMATDGKSYICKLTFHNITNCPTGTKSALDLKYCYFAIGKFGKNDSSVSSRGLRGTEICVWVPAGG